MSPPAVYKFRIVRKGLPLDEAQALVVKESAKHPDRDYRVVLLDGADGRYWNYRVVMLRG